MWNVPWRSEPGYYLLQRGRMSRWFDLFSSYQKHSPIIHFHKSNSFQISKQFSEKSKFVMMRKTESCPTGKEITTEEECKNALAEVYLLGISLGSRKNLVSGSWNHVPYQCSYQANGDKAFHFNQKEVSDVKEFKNGMYKMICRKGEYVAPIFQIENSLI